jgi:hypothetical protein
MITKYNLVENLHWKENDGKRYLTTLGISYVSELTSDESVAEVINVKVGNTISKYKKVKKSIGYIIREMIHHYGNEPFHNILIRDVDNKGLELLKYSEGDFYAFLDKNGKYTHLEFIDTLTRYKADTNIPIKLGDLTNGDFSTPDNLRTKIKNNIGDTDYYYVNKINGTDAAGYRSVELYWPSNDGLVVNAGDTITSVLDKICSTFGEYEYFYNV